MAKKAVLKDEEGLKSWRDMYIEAAQNNRGLRGYDIALHLAKKELVEEGHTELIYDLATDYLMGTGCDKNVKESQKLDFVAAEHKDTRSILRIARFYSLTEEQDDIYPPDDQESIKWYTKGAELGCVDCKVELGEMYMYSTVINHGIAEKYLKEAAQSGNVKAMEYLVELYRYSSASIDEAIYWCQCAIDNGSERAKTLRDTLN